MCVVSLLGVVRTVRPRPAQRGRCGEQTPAVGRAPRQSDPYVWRLPRPERARWCRWWRCSERQRAESGQGLPFLASEQCWETLALPSFHARTATAAQTLEDVGAMVRFYVTLHTAQEEWRT